MRPLPERAIHLRRLHAAERERRGRVREALALDDHRAIAERELRAKRRLERRAAAGPVQHDVRDGPAADAQRDDHAGDDRGDAPATDSRARS
jgi:hypothetical protein